MSRALGLLMLVVSSSGCITFTVSRTMMIPLQSAEPAAVAPNDGMFGGAYGAVSALPVQIDTHSGQAQRSDTGDQVAGVQPDVGGMFRINNHLLIGGNFYASPTSTAVKATPGELQLNDQLLFGFRTRVGYAGSLANGFGVVTTFGWGIDFLPYLDTAGTSTAQPAIGATLSAAGTYVWGRARLYLGAQLSSQPTITRSATTCAGCGTNISYDLQVALASGAKIQVAQTAAVMVGLAMPLVRDRVAWLPVLTVGLVFDFRPLERPSEENEAPLPPAPPPVYLPVAPPAAPL